MVPSSMDRDVRSDMSCRGCDADNADHVVGNASVDYRDEISVASGGVGVDDGSWSLVGLLIMLISLCFLFLKQAWTDGLISNLSSLSSPQASPLLLSILNKFTTEI